MNIAIGCDHAGYKYKEEISGILKRKGYNINDFGCFSEESVDYPDYAHQVANEVSDKENTIGILICGSGNGVCMTANKHEKIRAALCWTAEIAKLARQHNNANIICIPARFIDLNTAENIVNMFINTSFEGGRHQKRVDKIPFKK